MRVPKHISDGLLSDLRGALEKAGVDVTRKFSNTLIARRGDYTTEVKVTVPAERESPFGKICAVVAVRSTNTGLVALRPSPEIMADFNRRAALGAFTVDAPHKVLVGSRLTIYESEQLTFQLPLLVCSVLTAPDALLGDPRPLLSSGESDSDNRSEWTYIDLAEVANHLSRDCLCNADATGLTAEFGLRSGEVSAGMGDHRTALWELQSDKPHPLLGGGLLCLLQLPHQIASKSSLGELLVKLNQMEMAAYQLTPHFGAWCEGRSRNNPAYVSFLPNGLHEVNGIAVMVSNWARYRAQWANAMLASLGIVD